jgi:hypothetical protein
MPATVVIGPGWSFYRLGFLFQTADTFPDTQTAVQQACMRVQQTQDTILDSGDIDALNDFQKQLAETIYKAATDALNSHFRKQLDEMEPRK